MIAFDAHCPGCGLPIRMHVELSIRDAVKHGITQLRRDRWALPQDHIRLDIVKGHLGPWIRLYSPINMEIHGKNPVEIFYSQLDLDSPIYTPYLGDPNVPLVEPKN